MKKVIGKIVNAFLVLVVILAAGVMVLVGVNAKSGKATTVLGFGLLTVQTGSMSEVYPVGSVIVIKKTEPSQLKVGDDISFYTSDPTLNNIIVTHRIVAVTNDGDGTYSYTTRGTSNIIDDKYPAQSERLIGKVLGKSNLMQKLMTIREKPAAFLLIILFPMCIIITIELVNISKKMNESKDENENKGK